MNPGCTKGGGASHLHELCSWRGGEAGFVTVSKELAALWVRVAKGKTKPGNRGVGGGRSAGRAWGRRPIGGGGGGERQWAAAGAEGRPRFQLGWGQQRLAKAVSTYWRGGRRQGVAKRAGTRARRPE
eukprot:scaffold21785_cov103-Isochrysis_galbana.AAC.4